MPTSPTEFSSEERELLKGAFLRLIPRSDEMAKSLYAHLFERLPKARALFHGSMDDQRDKLVAMLALMIDALDRPPEFEDACRASGERHRGYGARPEHYEPLGEALMAALRETCVPPPTAQEESLWLRLFGYASNIMKRAT